MAACTLPRNEPLVSLRRQIGPPSAAVLSMLLCACSSDDAERPNVDLQVDASRDGVIDGADPLDQTHENVWNDRHGAVLLANLDDDDGDGLADGDDNVVNGTADEHDLARVLVAPWPSVPEDVTGSLWIDELAATHVRIHRHGADGSWTAVLGPIGPCGADEGDPACMPVAAWAFGAGDLAQGLELGIEALRFSGQGAAAGWDGMVQLSLQALDADGEPVLTHVNPTGGVDRAKMRVAPWLLLGNLSELDRVYAGFADPASQPFETALEPVVLDAGLSLHRVDDWLDRWTEDYFQTGYTAMPARDGQVQGLRVAMARPFGRTGDDEGLPIRWLSRNHLGAGAAVLEVYEEAHTGGSRDSFGNHDLIPPYETATESFPVGRIIYGAGVLPEVAAFYEAQQVQTPALRVDVDWLHVGHVDEVFSYAPAATERGWKLLVASPERARVMMVDWQGQGFGAALMFEGKWALQGPQSVPAEISIDQVLADPDRAAWNQLAQARIDEMLDDLGDALELQADEQIELPLVFEQVEPGQLTALQPASVNGRLFASQVVFPEPFGPLIDGVDGFRQDLLDRFDSAEHGLGSDGQGLAVSFVDDWAQYHVRFGEVHCATNVGGPPGSFPWWEIAR